MRWHCGSAERWGSPGAAGWEQLTRTWAPLPPALGVTAGRIPKGHLSPVRWLRAGLGPLPSSAQEGLKPSHLTLLSYLTPSPPARRSLCAPQPYPRHRLSLCTPRTSGREQRSPNLRASHPQRSQRVLGASPRQRGRAWVRQLGPIQTPTAATTLPNGFFWLFNSRSVFQHPLLPNRPFSLLPPLGRDGWSWLWGAEGTAWVTGTRGGRGTLTARCSPRPSPPHTPGAEERPYLAACKDDGRAGWLGSVRDGDTLRGRLGDRQRGQVRHRVLLAPTAPSPQPTPPGLCSALPAGPSGNPGLGYFFLFFLTLGTGPREDTQEHGRAVGDTLSCSQGPA